MIYTDIFHNHKIGMFLGASLAVHAAVLTHWSAPTGIATVAPSAHSVQMVLSTAIGAVETATTAPPVAATHAPEVKELPPAIEADTAALTAPLIMPLADLDTSISTAFQFVDAALPAAVNTLPVKPRALQTKLPAHAKPRPEKLRRLAALPTPAKVPQQHKSKPGKHAQQKPVTPRPATQKTATPAEITEVQLASAAAIEPAFAHAPAANKEQPANNSSEVRTVNFSLLSALLHKEILQHQRYPSRAKRRRREGISNVRFQLLPSGKFREIRLGVSSGSNSLDRAALAAVKQTSPLAQAGQYLTQAQVFSVNVVFKLR